MRKLLLLIFLSCNTVFATWETFLTGRRMVVISLPVINVSYCMYYACAHYKRSDRGLKQKAHCCASVLTGVATLAMVACVSYRKIIDK